MGRLTLLAIIAVTTPAHAETLRLAPESESPRVELAKPRSPPPPLRADLAAFAAARSQLFAPMTEVEPRELDIFELRDNVSREWAPDRDFELAAMWNALSIAINHHVLDRNWDEAQITMTLTRDL